MTIPELLLLKGSTEIQLEAEATAARPVDGDRVLAVSECPAQLAQIGAVGEAARLAEEAEDLRTAAIHARDGRGARHVPDRVLRDHLDQRAHVAAAERVEDAVDVLDRAYRSRGAIVSPRSSSWE